MKEWKSSPSYPPQMSLQRQNRILWNVPLCKCTEHQLNAVWAVKAICCYSWGLWGHMTLKNVFPILGKQHSTKHKMCPSTAHRVHIVLICLVWEMNNMQLKSPCRLQLGNNMNGNATIVWESKRSFHFIVWYFSQTSYSRITCNQESFSKKLSKLCLLLTNLYILNLYIS